MTVKEIVKQFLIDKGYDGLYHGEGMCACLTADLAPCSELSEECRAGYKTSCDGKFCAGDCGFHIVKDKEEK